jgi:5-methylthioadenosine/S-adenosylhomocysteine deaminase
MNIHIQDITAVLPDGVQVCSIYIQNDRIVSVDTAPTGFIPDKTIYGSGRLLIPGMINAHTHAYMSIFRNHADDLSFNDWLFGKILPLEDQLRPEDCYWGVMLSAMEMIATGTTTFLEMHLFNEPEVQAVADCGLRAVLSRGLTGGADDIEGGTRRLREALDAIEKWPNQPRLHFMLAPHAPYTCDDGYQREVAAEAKRLNIGIHTHLSESLTEIETIFNRYHCTPIELADRTGLLTDRTVAAHCVHLTDTDFQLLAARGTTVATNPISNLKLANGIAPIPKLLNAGVNVALGTDGPASNNALNMFQELKFLTLLHKGVTGDPCAVSAEAGFKIATANGAKALGLGHETGQIKPGLKADLVILNLDCPNMQPVNNPLAALAYSSTGNEVETVIVDGKILMENRQFISLDSERIYSEVEKICKRIGMR